MVSVYEKKVNQAGFPGEHLRLLVELKSYNY